MALQNVNYVTLNAKLLSNQHSFPLLQVPEPYLNTNKEAVQQQKVQNQNQ